MSSTTLDPERVLVLAPTDRDLRLTLDLLAQGGFAGAGCASLEALVAALPQGAGALLLTEEVETLPGIGAFAAAVSAQPDWSELPVLVLAHPTRDQCTLPHLGDLRGVTLLERPVRVRTLVSALRTALRARRRQYQLRDQLEAERRLQHRLATELSAMHRLHALATTLSGPRPLEEHLDEVLATAVDVVAADAAMLEMAPGADWPQPAGRVGRGLHPDQIAAAPRSPAPLTGAAAARPAEDDAQERSERAAWLAQAGFARGCGVALPSAAGECLGVLTVFWRDHETPDDHSVALGLLGRLSAGVLERARRDEERREAERRKDEFLAMLAHELRNPLAPIRQAVRAARSSGVTPEQLRWSQDVIDRQVRHMALLLDDLLDLSRITRGRMTLRRERIAARSAIEAALETSAPIIEARRHTLTVEWPEDAAWVYADPVRLSQVVSNLLNNAAKYTDAGGRIVLKLEVAPDEIAIRVADNGIGLAAAALDRVFEMFAQVDETHERSNGGLGIGLALVKGLVDLHGGRVGVSSDGIGRGSEFVVRLPRVDAPSDRTPAARPEPRMHRPPRHIVVADDNVDAAESLALVLRLSGHTVDVVHDGIAAVDAVTRLRPDVAILDIGMPRIDGYSAARQIRAAARDRRPRLIAVTGWGQDTDRRRSHEAGFDAHLTKPVDPEALLSMLATH